MSKREQYLCNLQCKKCGSKGSVTYEENENPVFSNSPERMIVSISKGFERGDNKDTTGDYEILCSTCKIPVAH